MATFTSPCNIGDTAYIRHKIPSKDFWDKGVEEIKIHGITFYGDGSIVLRDWRNMEWWLGKQVFLTREEAQKALNT